MTKKMPTNENHQGINYPARRLKEPYVQRPDDKVMAYPLPVGKMKFTAAKLQEPFSLPTSDVNMPTNDQQLYFEQYPNFNIGDPFHQSEPAFFGIPEMLAQPPVPTYLPLLLRPTDVHPYQNTINRNVSEFKEPARLSTKKNSLNLRVQNLNNELGQLVRRNLSRIDEPLLTFPFQAVITITRQMPKDSTTSKTQQEEYLTIQARDPLDDFLPYFENNYKLANESGQINVVLEDFNTGTNKKKIKKEKVEEKEEEENEKERDEQNVREHKKKSDKKKKGEKQQKPKNQQQFILGDLLRMLGILRKLPKNTTEISVGAPVLSILKGTNQQKIQVAFENVNNSQLVYKKKKHSSSIKTKYILTYMNKNIVTFSEDFCLKLVTMMQVLRLFVK